jgi:hypothetical protein
MENEVIFQRFQRDFHPRAYDVQSRSIDGYNNLYGLA